jgi:hypothetical protein
MVISESLSNVYSNSLKSFFRKEEWFLDNVLTYHFPEMERNTANNKVDGAKFDFSDKATGYKYELKVDTANTPNFYCEYKVSDQGVESPSGVLLSESNFYLVPHKNDLLVIHTYQLKCLTLEQRFKIVQTRPGANGNRAGFYSFGMLIPWTVLREMTDTQTLPLTETFFGDWRAA